jgi:hypothetical protein
VVSCFIMCVVAPGVGIGGATHSIKHETTQHKEINIYIVKALQDSLTSSVHVGLSFKHFLPFISLHFNYLSICKFLFHIPSFQQGFTEN